VSCIDPLKQAGRARPIRLRLGQAFQSCRKVKGRVVGTAASRALPVFALPENFSTASRSEPAFSFYKLAVVQEARYPKLAFKLFLVGALLFWSHASGKDRTPSTDSAGASRMNNLSGQSQAETTAAHISREISLDAANPAKEWDSALPVRFNADWQGKNSDPTLETEVRVLWSRTTLFLRFVCHYRELFVFDDSDPSGRRDHLWDRDVAEAFLQPPDAVPTSAHVAPDALVRGGEQSSPRGASLRGTGEGARAHMDSGGAESSLKYYKEFEVAPNGMWIDLDISPSGLADLKSGMTRSVHVDEKRKIWSAELAIPMKSITRNFDAHSTWRVNFYRVEGKTEPRKYMAWQPTMTPEPNFHVPEKFGMMRFQN